MAEVAMQTTDESVRQTPTMPEGVSGASETPANSSSANAWGENWRQGLAGEDRAALRTLERFPDPNALWKSYQSMRAKLSSGEARALPANATPEQQAQWRLENGIPESWDRYQVELEDGVQIGEADRALVNQYLEVAHGLNHTPAQVNANVSWYFSAVRQQEEAVADANLAARGECEAELRGEWGPEYRATLNGIAAMLDGAPEGVKESLLAAKNVDGTNLLNQPDVMRWLARMARELNPVATVVGAGGGQLVGIEDEIGQIEGVMKSDRAKYNGDERMQERLRKLYSVRERLRG
ncbi:MAG: hypothetical protein AB7R90_04090 [Reyranellaceae bacterium]